MSILKDSRYEKEYIFYDEVDSDKDFIDPIRETSFGETGESDYLIKVIEGMRLDVLAYEYYGNPSLQWVIMDANPQLDDPTGIKPGDVLAIPNPGRVVNRDE